MNLVLLSKRNLVFPADCLHEKQTPDPDMGSSGWKGWPRNHGDPVLEGLCWTSSSVDIETGVVRILNQYEMDEF